MSALPVPTPTAPAAPAGAALKLVPAAVPVSLNHTLYAIVDELQAFADSLELTEEGSPERAECEAAIEAWMVELPAKVDRFCRFLAHLENQVALAAAEIKRLQARKQAFERTIERMETYGVRVIEKLPEPKKGARKLEGETSTLSIRPSDGVIITSEAEVPAEYKTVVIELPLTAWTEVLGDRIAEVSKQLTKQELKIRLADIKRAMKAGAAVPGADLQFRNNLRRS